MSKTDLKLLNTMNIKPNNVSQSDHKVSVSGLTSTSVSECEHLWMYDLTDETMQRLVCPKCGEKQYREWCEALERCDHFWVNKAGEGYRDDPVEVCIKCGEKL